MTRLGWLKAAVAVMSVLIVAGVAVIGVTIVRRAGGRASERAGGRLAATADMVLHEPAGTRIASVTASGDRIVLLLSGGGPDRLAVLDARDGQAVLRVAVAP